MTQQTPPSAAAAHVGLAVIRGRIRSVRAARGQRRGWLHVLAMPAPDEFSAPAVVEVFAGERLGAVDDTWQGRVSIGGYRRSYKTDVTDERSGEVRQVQVETADVTLTALL